MKLAEITVNGVDISAKALMQITSGMIGATVGISFDESWDALDKIVVFRADKIVQDVVGVTDWTAVKVPHEVLETPGHFLGVGVYGYNADKTLAVPTVWTDVSIIRTGTDPDGDPAADPSLPIYAQLQEQINETHAGTPDDPIPYDGNMALEEGKYYIQDYVIYLCIRNSEIAVHQPLNDLVGLYVNPEP